MTTPKQEAITERLAHVASYINGRGIATAKSLSFSKQGSKFGNSGYIGNEFGADIKFKIRVSDHGCGGARIKEEICISHTDTLIEITERLERAFNTARWSDKVVIREEINTEKGIKGIFPNATIELIQAGIKTSKKGNVLNLYRVAYSKKVFK